jgi:hypothetical protein
MNGSLETVGDRAALRFERRLDPSVERVWRAITKPDELRPDGDGCVLVFTHVFADRALGAQHAAGWEIYLGRLDVHLDGSFLSEEEAHDRAPELQRRYAERFGLNSD